MDVRKTIEELTSQLTEVNYDSEEENILLKDSRNNDLIQSGKEDNDYTKFEPSKLRKANSSISLPECTYGGKVTSRKKTYSLDASDDLSSNDYNDEGSPEDSNEGSFGSEDEEEQAVQSKSKKQHRNEVNIYSAGSKTIANEVKKGVAIKNQLRIWESLLECRIKLQRGLFACNSLPTKENLSSVKTQLELENQQKFGKCKKNLLLLLDKMVGLHKELVKHSSEFRKGIVANESNEEIPSDESEIEDDDLAEEEEERQPVKKRKLNDYSTLIKNDYNKFVPFRNAAIQKWNDKTKISTGKMANSNFSAFDQSTLKQIEQIMADKIRLINRTRIKRSGYQDNNMKEEGVLTQEMPLDVEIFDDSDFYHKLLRDYIERKSVDATLSHSERQLIELQKLRNKMKKNVDTKSTKGRKLRYAAVPKLMNLMAPDPYNTWSELAETELYNSLFGKIKVR